MIGRDKSVVCREVARNRGPDGSYWAPVAHRAAHERRRRPKDVPARRRTPACAGGSRTWMDQGWSPKLIARGSARTERRTRSWTACRHETIYQALYVQTRGGLRADLHRQLSLKRRQRKPRDSTDGRGKSLYTEAFTIRAAARRGRGPGRARALGRRPGHGRRRTPRRSAPWSSGRPGSRSCCTCPAATTPQSVAEAMIREMSTAARAPAPVADLGPRQRAGRVRTTSSSSSACRSTSAPCNA